MPPRALAWAFFVLAASLAAPARAQSCAKVFGPYDAEIRVPQSVLYDQIWPQPARGPLGWTFTWSEGQDVFARLFDPYLNPLGPQFRVNTVFNLGIQDEPAICHGTTGNFLVAWSERYGYDGSAMGIFARTYSASGVPLTGEFLVNTTTFASQWRPLIAPTPSGGFVVAWSGDYDGNAYFRVLDPNGAYLTGEVRVNVYSFDAQVDPAPAVAPDGTIFIAYIDYSGSTGNGNGLNILGRTFTADGTPMQPQEFAITTWAGNGPQRDPRVAADGLGRFFVVWEDYGNDGSGYGIFERVFDSSGNPLGPEFVVNSTTNSDQRQARIAVDHLGRALVTWLDFSAGFSQSDIRARRFNAQAFPEGPDFVVNENPASGVLLPSPAMDWGGREMVIAFEGPGVPGQGYDAYAKRYVSTGGPHAYCTPKQNSLGCWPQIASVGQASASSPNPFWIQATSVLNQKPAILLYGFGTSFAPYYGTSICIVPPLRALPFQATGGNVGPTDCSGALSVDFNAFIQSGSDPRLAPGATVSARWWYRDNQDPTGYGSGFTNAVRFSICP